MYRVRQKNVVPKNRSDSANAFIVLSQIFGICRKEDMLKMSAVSSNACLQPLSEGHNGLINELLGRRTKHTRTKYIGKNIL